MSITSGYGQGTSFTNVQGPSGMDVSPFLMALLQAEQRHLSNRAQTRGTISPSASAYNRTTRTPRMAPGGEGDQRGQLQEKLLKAQANKASAEAKAMSGLTPTRMSTVGGQSFATPDHLAMSGAQRSVFLPNNAQQIGGIGEMSPEDIDFLLRMRAGRGAR